MNNLQAFNEARSMLDDLNDCETLWDLNQLAQSWLGYQVTTDDADTIADLRDCLRDHIKSFCYDCGIHCGYVGV